MSNTKEKAPINWHFICHKNDMQEKVNVLVRLDEAMQKILKAASYSEPIKIFTLVPDK